ncbi:MAG TPA: hypothetical protein VHP35_06130, partial [Terriglobia bacterium]|nr:hypothetical protein [Terriglobia bacterium]
TEDATLFVPIVLSAAGLNSSFFTSELTLTNRGPKDATLDLTYVPAFGEGSGSVTTTLPAGKQWIFPDAIEYLRSLGLPILATGNQGGTVSIHVAGTSPSDVAAMVRTATAAGRGRAGLAYPAVPASKALNDPVYLLGLRQNEQDRSNVAVQNAGGPGEGDIVLRLTIFSGDRGRPLSLVLPEIQLGPGEFRQINGILNSVGGALLSGYVRVEKLSGSAPYYAYGVINDQMSSDGSFVPPTPRFLAAGQFALWLPAVVESDEFNTEVVVTNWSASRKVIQLGFQAQALANDGKVASVSVELDGGEQKIIPRFVQYLRDHGMDDVGPMGPTYVGQSLQQMPLNLSAIFWKASRSARVRLRRVLEVIMGSFTLGYPTRIHPYSPAFGFMACSRIRRIVLTWPWQVQEFRPLKIELPVNSGLNFLTVTKVLGSVSSRMLLSVWSPGNN